MKWLCLIMLLTLACGNTDVNEQLVMNPSFEEFNKDDLTDIINWGTECKYNTISNSQASDGKVSVKMSRQDCHLVTMGEFDGPRSVYTASLDTLVLCDNEDPSTCGTTFSALELHWLTEEHQLPDSSPRLIRYNSMDHQGQWVTHTFTGEVPSKARRFIVTITWNGGGLPSTYIHVDNIRLTMQ